MTTVRVNIYSTRANPLTQFFTPGPVNGTGKCSVSIENFSLSHFVADAAGFPLGSGLVSILLSGIRDTLHTAGGPSSVVLTAPLRVQELPGAGGHYLYARGQSQNPIYVGELPFSTSIHISLSKADGVTQLTNHPDEFACTLVYKFADV